MGGGYGAGMNLPHASQVLVDRTNEPSHAPGELVLLLEAPGVESQARHDTVRGDYILHGSVVRGQKQSYTFAVRRVPRLGGVRGTLRVWRGGECRSSLSAAYHKPTAS